MTYTAYTEQNKRNKEIGTKPCRIEAITFDTAGGMVRLSSGITITIAYLVQETERYSICVTNPSILRKWSGFDKE